MRNIATNTRSTLRATVFGSVVVGVICVALAAPVLAFASRSTKTVVVHSFGSANAVCPKGEHVGFGGFVSPRRKGLPVVGEGMRLTAPDRWTVYGASLSAGRSGSLSAVAYCDHGTAGPRVASKTVPLVGTGTAIATCPAGTVVVGGGYNSAAIPMHAEYVQRLERVGLTQWRVTMINVGLPTTMTAYAFCSGGVAPKLASATVKVPGDGVNTTAQVSCPKGTALVGGGFVENGTGGLDVVPQRLTAASTTQWVVAGYGVFVYLNGNSHAATLTALAYCR